MVLSSASNGIRETTFGWRLKPWTCRPEVALCPPYTTCLPAVRRPIIQCDWLELPLLISAGTAGTLELLLRFVRSRAGVEFR
ncbi:hypothetical protein GCM10008949_49600 [Deinococcus humi]|nr:hypothetical protein GCM10008949_49600 [Deinococcus humi]